MMDWLVVGILILFILLVGFFIILPLFFKFGASYEATGKRKFEEIVKLANPKKKDRFVDLGSGDGRIVIEFAKYCKISEGYEVNPILVLWSRWKIKHLGVKNAKIYWKSFWKVNLGRYDIVNIFQIYHIMPRLKKKLERECNNCRIISYWWKIPGWKYIKRKGRLYLYKL
jgi:hypothetical protein